MWGECVSDQLSVESESKSDRCWWESKKSERLRGSGWEAEREKEALGVWGRGRCQSDTIVTGTSVRMPVQVSILTSHHQWQVSPQFLNRDPQIRSRERRKVWNHSVSNVANICIWNHWSSSLLTAFADETFHPSNSGRNHIVLWPEGELGDVVHGAIVVDHEDVMLPVTPGSWTPVGHRHHWFHRDHLEWWHRGGFWIWSRFNCIAHVDSMVLTWLNLLNTKTRNPWTTFAKNLPNTCQVWSPFANILVHATLALAFMSFPEFLGNRPNDLFVCVITYHARLDDCFNVFPQLQACLSPIIVWYQSKTWKKKTIVKIKL